jgi:multicomponent Na+:H+ antiporter subunit A
MLVVADRGGVPTLDAPWAPRPAFGLHFAIDGLGIVYGLLALAIGAVVLVYASAYLPRHLAHHGRTLSDAPRFHGLIVLFMVAMAGLVTARTCCWCSSSGISPR